jgi:argininosuccinate synthase
MKQKVVLAFSGGLDTSYCARFLAEEMDLEVYSVVVNTGGFSEKELAAIGERALTLGVSCHHVLDETGPYYQKCLKYLIFGNVLKHHVYPLSVSAERVFQAVAIARYASEVGASFIAHGSTGAGNDQVRFDVIFNILVPEINVLTPIRDQNLARSEEISYLSRSGIKMDWEKALYSINQGLWGTTIGGKETLTTKNPLPETAYPTALSADKPQIIKLHFEKGELSGIDEKKRISPVELIRKLNKLAGSYGIGRDIHLGDTIVGLKGRVGFEAPAPVVIIRSHQELEKCVLTKWQLYWKDQLAGWYGMMLHEGQFLDPVMRDIEVFLSNSQELVTGTVTVKLSPGRFEVQGIDSPHNLMSEKFGTYGEKQTGWNGIDVKGFARIQANQTRIFYGVNGWKDPYNI